MRSKHDKLFLSGEFKIKKGSSKLIPVQKVVAQERVVPQQVFQEDLAQLQNIKIVIP